jgi:hypothetical protein
MRNKRYPRSSRSWRIVGFIATRASSRLAGATQRRSVLSF